MGYKIRTRPEEWACTKFCRIELSDTAVENFVLWLCDQSKEQVEQRIGEWSKGEDSWIDPVESMWGWDAPRQRMAKLLWQAVHNDASDEEFHKRFSFPGLECPDSVRLLGPIQQRLKWVMEGLFKRQEQDIELRQGDWGEYWWLPEEQAEFVRTQLRHTHVDLIEQCSEYDDALRYSLCFQVRHVVQAIAVPCSDPDRVYVGTHCGPTGRTFVWVQSESGRKYPLKHGARVYLEADGTGYSWGYPGHGPGELAHCMLVDALDGDLVTAAEFEDEFFKEYTFTYPRDEDLRISRNVVMKWLEKRGAKTKWESRRQLVAAQLSKHAGAIADKESLLERVTNMGGLRTQRFDIAPATFESALYLDLMRMLEHSDYALRCSGCGLPIPYDNSGRANRQRARAKKGQPIYHPECFVESGRTRKKIYWQRRSRTPEFRDQQRRRAREYRRLS